MRSLIIGIRTDRTFFLPVSFQFFLRQVHNYVKFLPTFSSFNALIKHRTNAIPSSNIHLQLYKRSLYLKQIPIFFDYRKNIVKRHILLYEPYYRLFTYLKYV